MTGHGGRPRDPLLDDRIVQAATQILAEQRTLTADDLAVAAHVGKASIYRRWRTLDALLVEVVADLGIRDTTIGTPGTGDTREDLLALLTAASTGIRALAEAAVLPQIGLRVELRRAYADGPFTRLEAAVALVHERAVNRGEKPWWSNAPVAGGAALLLQQIQTTGLLPDDEDIEQVVDLVVLPGLGLQAVTS